MAKGFLNNVGKEGNAGNTHFLLSPNCFQTHESQYFFIFRVILNLSSANAFKLDKSKILSFAKYFTQNQTMNSRLSQIARICRRHI